MEAIVRQTCEQLLRVLGSWETVDTVAALAFGDDRYDPGFFVSVDVYYHRNILDVDQRHSLFSFAGAFEASVDGQKDRFLVDDVPVRVEYKAIRDIEASLDRVDRPDLHDCAGSTYGFYRFHHAEVLFARSNWFGIVANHLRSVPEEYWVRRCDALAARMEHTLGDLSAAVYADQDLFYQLSLARFVDDATRLVLALNRRFDPPGRLLYQSLSDLARIPEEFHIRFDHLIGNAHDMPRTRKRQIAELLARSLLVMR